MKKAAITSILLLVISGSPVPAKPSVRHMQSNTLAIEYCGALRGQRITEAGIKSHERIQLCNFAFAPVEYVQFSIGFGAERFRVDEYNSTKFNGKYGFIPSAIVSLNSPAFLQNILRVTANFDFIYLNSKDDYHYKYSGPILNPSAGIMIYAGKYVDIEIGARGHFIAGTMENTQNKVESPFSNSENVKGYLALTLTAPNGAYCQMNFDASPEASKNLRGGPDELMMGFCVGFMLTPKKPKSGEKGPNRYFPKYGDLKNKQDKMAKELE